MSELELHNFKELLSYNNDPFSLFTIEGIDPGKHLILEIEDYQMRS